MTGPRFREGQRVRNTGFRSLTGVPNGMTGTVAKVATVGGKSIYPDPCRLMVFVEWDNGQKQGVFRSELERVKP